MAIDQKEFKIAEEAIQRLAKKIFLLTSLLAVAA